VECIRYVGADETACGFPDDTNIIWYDITPVVQLNAAFNILLTTVIVACLAASSYFFSKDAQLYVVMPIETMLKYLRRVMVGDDGSASDGSVSDGSAHSGKGAAPKPPETDLLATYVHKLVSEIDTARWKAEEEASIAESLLNAMELRWWEAGPEQRQLTIADSFPCATVLFTDLVGFTSLSSRMSAEEAMRQLNAIYTVFDSIVEKHKLYKVETIGDSYMLVGGAPHECEDHAERVAAAALEIRASVPRLQELSGEPELGVRIGMHRRAGGGGGVGPVTAGVVGFKNPRWHLFGDTCNTASRMESTGISGEIQLSAASHELIRHRFACKLRGKVPVKGKGEMVTYLLEEECAPGTKRRPGSSLGPAALAAALAVGGGVAGEAFLTSPQFKKAVERYAIARSSYLGEEEALVKLLAALDDDTAAAAAAAAGLVGDFGEPDTPPTPPRGATGSGEGPGGGGLTLTLSPAAGAGEGRGSPAADGAGSGGVVVPRVAAGLQPAAFKQVVLARASAADLKALALHLHSELGVARALASAAEEEKRSGARREAFLRLYGRVIETPDMSLRDLFGAVVEAVNKVLECDVVKLYVVDHGRGVLWPASKHGASERGLPLDGTLAGSAVRGARLVAVEDAATADDFDPDLEELPAGYGSRSMLCVPVFAGAAPRLLLGSKSRPGSALGRNGSAAAGRSGSALPASGEPSPSPRRAGKGMLGGAASSAEGLQAGDVLGVIVAVNRWSGWTEAGGAGDRRIVAFSRADESAARDAALAAGLLLMRWRDDILEAMAASRSALTGPSFSVAALTARGVVVAPAPPSPTEAELRGAGGIAEVGREEEEEEEEEDLVGRPPPNPPGFTDGPASPRIDAAARLRAKPTAGSKPGL
ncbi:hypothetical protein HYH03_019044, partial [Edaphochlamys debaryana]